MRSWFLLMMCVVAREVFDGFLLFGCFFWGEGCCGLLFFEAVSQVGKAGHKLGVQLKMTLNSCS